MLNIVRTRIRQGHRTADYPAMPPTLPERFRGLPILQSERCAPNCVICANACPTEAIGRDRGKLTIDLGRCVFCGDCSEACPNRALEFGGDHRLSTTRRDDLLTNGTGIHLAAALDKASLRLFGRSLKLRQVSAGGCNACEADTNVLNTLVFDLGRFGIQFVASPRHADGILVTGPVSSNMELALRKTYDAIPAPKLVIALGACAISGGLFRGHDEVCGGIPGDLRVDLYVPGCPPHPYTILDGLLRLLDRIG
jgi:Ni,Fe-hydrogenase III small subunit/ferredoxin